ncbi:helix-turn-helix transcriptional regulator [Paenibacillus crassostreae]|uniref:AraC family transcriptional regulator n=1 Tax=Paenibacillus crassostreae TaxID=1763538 RepID=A0A167APD2_9BACL|nr:AraC family transcriptional regulator [Paenibacillus crassostreae]AOZ93741.1 AraC family transcriptional regulator [Paenibacillus crassostreae]OAB71276.1 AraC family transcriptional regulator [Paenibacillus crassostreae]
MNQPYHLQYHDPFHRIDLEYDRRIGHFNMHHDHIHNHYEIYYLCSGERSYFIKDRSYHIVAGDLVFIDCNAVHKTSDVGIPDHERIVIYLGKNLLEQFYPEWLSLLEEPFTWDVPILRLPPHESIYLTESMNSIKNELLTLQPSSSLLFRHRIVELLLHAHRQQQHNMLHSHEESTPIHRKIAEITRYLNDHLADSITLTDVANHFYISPFYLSHLFKESTGFTFSSYLSLTRIKEAQRLLRESQLSISEIAWQSGFENFSHFGKTFKKTSHMSPRDYRKQHRSS